MYNLFRVARIIRTRHPNILKVSEIMKLIAPDYYDKFSCTADRCRHSCCVGWEIDIDEGTYEYYKTVGGKLGNDLRENIAVCDGTASFTLDENERCPFLEKDGLCRLIKELGEGSLCGICADHPRFRSFYSQRTEIGLGLCCEAAAELILKQEHKVGLITLEEDEESLTEDEEYLLGYRNQLFATAQDREFTVEERLENLGFLGGTHLPEKSFAEWADVFLSLERLDEAWTDKLNLLKQATGCAVPSSLQLAFEQLLIYLLYRHIPRALDDGDIASKIGFAVLSVKIVAAILSEEEKQDFETFAELVRLYSSEIEYSDENLNTIWDLLYEQND